MRFTPRLFGSALAVASSLSLGFACGGSVVLDGGDGGAGQGGSTGSGGSTGKGSTGTGPSTTTSGGAGGASVATNCTIFCDTFTNNECTDPSCYERCEQASIEQPCGDEFTVWIGCIAKGIDQVVNCDGPPECKPLGEAFLSCSEGGCGPQSCVADDNGGCSCAISCDGASFQATCKVTANGSSVCACVAGGMVVGECISQTSSCDIFETCCAPILFGDTGG